jgi:hypothetical protein
MKRERTDLEQSGEGLVAQRLGETGSESFTCSVKRDEARRRRGSVYRGEVEVKKCGAMDAPWVVAQPQVAPYDVLQESHRLTLDQLAHHVAQHRPDRVEPLVGLADVGQSELVEQDLLDDEDGDRLGQLGPSLHDAKTEGDDLGRQEEVDDGRVVVLLESSGVASGRRAGM